MDADPPALTLTPPLRPPRPHALRLPASRPKTSLDSIASDVLEKDVEAFNAASHAWDSATEHAAEAARAAEGALEAARVSDVAAARSFAETAADERVKAQSARDYTAEYVVGIGVAAPEQ